MANSINKHYKIKYNKQIDKKHIDEYYKKIFREYQKINCNKDKIYNIEIEIKKLEKGKSLREEISDILNFILKTSIKKNY